MIENDMTPNDAVAERWDKGNSGKMILAGVLVAGVVLGVVWVRLSGGRAGSGGETEGAAKECVVTGCNGEICEEKKTDQTASICVLLPEAQCYKTAKCEQQRNGQCGGTQTEELKECIEKSKL